MEMQDNSNRLYAGNAQEISLPQRQGTAGVPLSSLILGIVAFVFCILPVISVPCSLIGVILGCVSLVVKRDGTAMSIVGVILGSIALLISVVVLINLFLSGSLTLLSALFSVLFLF